MSEQPTAGLNVEGADVQVVAILGSDVSDPNLQKTTASGVSSRVLQTVGFSPNSGDYPVFVPHTLPILGAGDLESDLPISFTAYEQAPAFCTLLVALVRLEVLDALILGGHRPIQDVAVIDYSTGLAVCGRHTQKNCCYQQEYDDHHKYSEASEQNVPFGCV